MPITEAVAAYRTLAQARPDAFAFVLAASLTNQATRMGELGRREEALGIIAEALQMRQRLVRARPNVHQAELEQTLSIKEWLENLPNQ